MAGCCDNRRGEREIPDGIEPCCSIAGPRCLCLPYDDPYLISAQILTIASLFFGWISHEMFFISLVGVPITQVLWCARMNKGVLYGQVAIATLISMGHLIVALYVLVAWRKVKNCWVWDMRHTDYYTQMKEEMQEQVCEAIKDSCYCENANDDEYCENQCYIDAGMSQCIQYDNWPYGDQCMERTWFAIGLVSSLMWAAAAVCIFWFVKSGRHAKWEAKYLPSKGDVEIITQEGDVVADAAVVGETEKEDTV